MELIRQTKTRLLYKPASKKKKNRRTKNPGATDRTFFKASEMFYSRIQLVKSPVKVWKGEAKVGKVNERKKKKNHIHVDTWLPIGSRGDIRCSSWPIVSRYVLHCLAKL